MWSNRHRLHWQRKAHLGYQRKSKHRSRFIRGEGLVAERTYRVEGRLVSGKRSVMDIGTAVVRQRALEEERHERHGQQPCTRSDA